MSCGECKAQYEYGDGLTTVLTCGKIRDVYRQGGRRMYMRRGLIQLFPDVFRLKGLKNRLKYRIARFDDSPEYYVSEEVFRMAQDGKSTFALADGAPVVLTAGNLRKAADKMCSDWKKGLEIIFPEAFARVRLYPNLVDGCFAKSAENIPLIIRMDDDGTWKYVNLKTGKASDWKRIHDFEDVLSKYGCTIITKEEACAML